MVPHRSAFACLARLTVYFPPTIQIMIDGTVYSMVVFRSAASSGASCWVSVRLKSTSGIPRSLSSPPLALAAVLTAAIWSGKNKSETKSNEVIGISRHMTHCGWGGVHCPMVHCGFSQDDKSHLIFHRKYDCIETRS